MHEDWYKQFKILTKSKSKSPNPFTEISEQYIDWCSLYSWSNCTDSSIDWRKITLFTSQEIKWIQNACVHKKCGIPYQIKNTLFCVNDLIELCHDYVGITKLTYKIVFVNLYNVVIQRKLIRLRTK